MIKGVLLLLILFAISTVYSIPTIDVIGATKQLDNLYYIDMNIKSPQPILIHIKNEDNESYKVEIRVESNIDVCILDRCGTSLKIQDFILDKNDKRYIRLELLPYNNYNSGQILLEFKFYNLTNPEQLVDIKSIVLTVRFYSDTQEPQPDQDKEEEPSVCLLPFRTKIKKTLFINETIEVSIGVINQCNDDITLLDVDIEGVPNTIARIKDASLSTLDPGRVQYIKLVIDTSQIKKPTQLSFDVVFVAKKENTIETATTNVEVLVLDPDKYVIPPPNTESKQPLPNIPEGTLPLRVDYAIENGYLVIRGAYVLWNHTKIYLPRVNIQVISDESAITYMYPIKLKPGKTYCISAVDPKQEYISFFKCFSVSKNKLCVSFSPSGKEYGGIIYFPLNTKVNIERVYNCEDLSDVTNYKLLFDGKLIENRTLIIDDENTHELIFKAEGYDDLVIKIRGWKPVKIASPLPKTIGNHTILLEGTLSKNTKLTLYKIENGTMQKLVTKIGNEIKITIPSPGEYVIRLEAPLQDPIEHTIYIGTEEKTESNIDLVSILKTIIVYIVIFFIVLTIICIIIYYKVRRETLSGAVQEITRLIRK